MIMQRLLDRFNYKAKYLAAFVLGVILVGALPPLFILPLAIISFTGFYLLLQECTSKKQAFWLGWWFGFGYFLFGFYWVANSLLVDAQRFAWLIPFSITLIPAISGLFVGVVGLATYCIKQSPLRKILIFSCLWVITEMLRGLITQFPWNFVGYMWLSPWTESIAQLASITGVFGLSLLLVVTATLPAILWSRGVDGLVLVMRWKPLVVMILILVLIAECGVIYINQNIVGDISSITRDNNPMIRIIQPNITQQDRHNPDKQFDIFSKQLSMTSWRGKSGEGEQPDIIIWPEAAINYSIERDVEVRNMMARAMQPDSILIAGGMRYAYDSNRSDIWNSLFVVDGVGQVRGFYDKHILVPFGEFVPLQKYIPFVEKITQGSQGFSRGQGVRTLKTQGYPSFSPLICYEAVFSGQVVDENNRPDMLLNITNDAWFGDGIGPQQHLHITRMRAIEEGLPLIRVANTGVSAVIDSHGRIRHSLALNTDGIIDFKFSDDLKNENVTIFAKYGHISVIILLLVALVFLLSSYRYCAGLRR